MLRCLQLLNPKKYKMQTKKTRRIRTLLEKEKVDRASEKIKELLNGNMPKFIGHNHWEREKMNLITLFFATANAEKIKEKIEEIKDWLNKVEDLTVILQQEEVRAKLHQAGFLKEMVEPFLQGKIQAGQVKEALVLRRLIDRDFLEEEIETMLKKRAREHDPTSSFGQKETDLLKKLPFSKQRQIVKEIIRRALKGKYGQEQWHSVKQLASEVGFLKNKEVLENEIVKHLLDNFFPQY